MSISSISASGVSSAQVDVSALRKRMTENMFKETDTNGDGKISKDEFAKQAEKMKVNGPAQSSSSSGTSQKTSTMPDPAKLFDQADSDGDGSISQDELQALTDSMDAQRPTGAAPAGGPPPGGAKTGTDSSSDSSNSSADTNGDGVVSAQEKLMYEMSRTLEKYAKNTVGVTTSASGSTVNLVT